MTTRRYNISPTDVPRFPLIGARERHEITDDTWLFGRLPNTGDGLMKFVVNLIVNRIGIIPGRRRNIVVSKDFFDTNFIHA